MGAINTAQEDRNHEKGKLGSSFKDDTIAGNAGFCEEEFGDEKIRRYTTSPLGKKGTMQSDLKKRATSKRTPASQIRA